MPELGLLWPGEVVHLRSKGNASGRAVVGGQGAAVQIKGRLGSILGAEAEHLVHLVVQAQSARITVAESPSTENPPVRSGNMEIPLRRSRTMARGRGTAAR